MTRKIHTLRNEHATVRTRLAQLLEQADDIQTFMMAIHWKSDNPDESGAWSSTWVKLTSQEMAMAVAVLNNDLTHHLSSIFDPSLSSLNKDEPA